jgi:hypothetical protein
MIIFLLLSQESKIISDFIRYLIRKFFKDNKENNYHFLFHTILIYKN